MLANISNPMNLGQPRSEIEMKLTPWQVFYAQRKSLSRTVLGKSYHGNLHYSPHDYWLEAKWILHYSSGTFTHLLAGGEENSWELFFIQGSRRSIYRKPQDFSALWELSLFSPEFAQQGNQGVQKTGHYSIFLTYCGKICRVLTLIYSIPISVNWYNNCKNN